MVRDETAPGFLEQIYSGKRNRKSINETLILTVVAVCCRYEQNEGTRGVGGGGGSGQGG